MDELPSTEFRKRFARLTKATVVTVNGHPIGVWLPGAPADVPSVGASDTLSGEGFRLPAPAVPRFNTRPFTPVPKKGK